jgi:Bacterial Ig domain
MLLFLLFILLYGSSAKTSSSSQSDSKNAKNSGSMSEVPSKSDRSSNHAPVAHDDKFVTEVNKPLLAPILKNDDDPDGNKLKIISLSLHSKKGGTVTVNENGTLTFLPAIDFTGLDTFSYTISDDKGKTDKGKVSVIVKVVDNNRPEDNTKHVAPHQY